MFIDRVRISDSLLFSPFLWSKTNDSHGHIQVIEQIYRSCECVYVSFLLTLEFPYKIMATNKAASSATATAAAVGHHHRSPVKGILKTSASFEKHETPG